MSLSVTRPLLFTSVLSRYNSSETFLSSLSHCSELLCCQSPSYGTWRSVLSKDPFFSLDRFNDILDYNMNNATRQLGLLLLLCVALHADCCSRREEKEKPPVGKFLYSTVSNPQDCSKRFTLYFPGRPVQLNTISTSLWSIQPYATINAPRLLVHISTTF